MLADRKLLIVNDRDDELFFLKDYFSVRDYDVETAKSGEEALKVMEWYKPSLVILDLILPGMDGLECLQKMKALDKGTPVLMTSGAEDEDRERRAHELKAHEYFKKPYSLSKLEAAVNGLV